MLGGLEAGQRRGARIPCEVCGYPTIRIAKETGRIDPRVSQRASEVYSPSKLKLVSRLVSPTSTSSGSDHHVLVGSWLVVRVNIV